MSKLYVVDLRDATRGLFVAMATVILMSIYPIIEQGTWPTVVQLKAIGLSGLAAGVAYIIKNFLTNSKDQMLKKETP